MGEIDEPNTPAQARDFGRYLQQNSGVAKVAVVSLLPRAPRYIQHVAEAGGVPEGVEFYGVPVPIAGDLLGAGVREVRKVGQYYRMGHLAAESAVSEHRHPRGGSVLSSEGIAEIAGPRTELTPESARAIHDLVTEPFDGEAP